MKTDIQEFDDHYEMKLELPGYDKADIKVNLKDGNLTIEADRHEEKDEKDEKPILSARELEVLKLIAQEFTNEEIGEKLFISERTVEAHRRNIFIKTKTKSIVGLMKYAIINGLITVK